MSKKAGDTPEQTPADEGLDELKAIEGELEQAESTSAHAEARQRDDDLKNKTDPYDRQMAGIAAMAGMGLCSFIAKRRGAHWNLSDEEAEGFGVAVAKTIESYFPDSDYPPYIELLIVSGVIVGGRLAVDAMSAKAANDESKDKSRSEGNASAES